MLYILAFFFVDESGVSKVSWSIYRYGSESGEENMIGLEKDFVNMLNSEEWTKEEEGAEVVVAR
jgi:hypothetical protein